MGNGDADSPQSQQREDCGFAGHCEDSLRLADRTWGAPRAVASVSRQLRRYFGQLRLRDDCCEEVRIARLEVGRGDVAEPDLDIAAAVEGDGCGILGDHRLVIDVD